MAKQKIDYQKELELVTRVDEVAELINKTTGRLSYRNARSFLSVVKKAVRKNSVHWRKIEGLNDKAYVLNGLRERVPWFRRITTKMFSWLFSAVAMRRVTDASTGFKAFKIEILRHIDFSLKWLEDRYGIETYFSIMAIKKGYKFTEVPVRKFYHETGYSKMRFGIDYWYNVKPILKCIFIK